jgi:hypothetical protein
MKRLKVLAGLLVLVGSLSITAYGAVSSDLAWVAIDFRGGKQCEPASKYDPPDIKQLLGKAGIAVSKTIIERGLIPAACGFPSYAATHYALIHRNQINAAQQMGFYLPPTSPEVMKEEIEKLNRELKAKFDSERKAVEDTKRREAELLKQKKGNPAGDL